MKRCFFVIIIFFFLFIQIDEIYSYTNDDDSVIDLQMEKLELDEISKIIGESTDEIVNKISIKELSLKAVRGELDLSPSNILKNISYNFFGELNSLISLIRNMIFITIFSALLNNLSLSLKEKAVSELGFYISYLVIIMILISSFNVCIGVMYELVNGLCMIMQSAIPTIITLMVVSGNVNSAFVFNPIIILIVNVFSALIKDYIVPIIIFAAILRLINYISEKEVLQKLSDLIKNIASWSLKGISVLFVALLSLQGISAPIIDNVVSKSAKATLNVVPVVGQALSSAVDTVMYWTGAVKSGVMVAIIIVIIMMCAVPIIKLITFVFVFKLTAAIIQPISDVRVVKAIDSIGAFTAILIGVCVTVAVMFIFMTMVMLSH